MSVSSREDDIRTFLDAMSGGQGESAQAIAHTTLDLLCMLLKKNHSYGDSARNPVAVFAKGIDPATRMGVRMDDKISRLMRGDETVFDEEDTVQDFAGYCILLMSLRN